MKTSTVVAEQIVPKKSLEQILRVFVSNELKKGSGVSNSNRHRRASGEGRSCSLRGSRMDLSGASIFLPCLYVCVIGLL